MKEKIAIQKKIVEEAEKNLGQEKKKLGELIFEHQKSCPHKNKKEIFAIPEDRLDRLQVLAGYLCEDCDFLIPSKVWNKKVPSLPRLDKYCRVCDGDVECLGRSGFTCSGDREDWYKCKVCGREQKEFVG